MTTTDETRVSSPANAGRCRVAGSDGRVPRPVRARQRRVTRRRPGGGPGRDAVPLFMTRAQGSRIWDVDGNEYVDFHNSFGAVLLGHNDPRINRAVIRAMDEHGVSFSAANPLEVELAERLVGMIPSAERVVFSCTGTEATYHAIRLARGFTGRERILKFEGNYHGWHDYVAWSHHFATDEGGDVPDARPAVGRDAGRGPRPVSSASTTTRPASATVLAEEGDSIAAVILEPVFHNAGVVAARAGLPRGAPRGVHRGRDAAHLRRGHHRLPPRSGRRAGAATASRPT